MKKLKTILKEANIAKPKKGKRTPDDATILVKGMGTLEHKQLKDMVYRKIEDLLKRAKKGDYHTIGIAQFYQLSEMWNTLKEHSGR